MIRKPKAEKWTDLDPKFRKKLEVAMRDLKDRTRYIVASPKWLGLKDRRTFDVYMPEDDTYGWWSTKHPTWKTTAFKRKEAAEAVARWVRKRKHAREFVVASCKIDEKGEAIRKTVRFPGGRQRKPRRLHAPDGGAK